MPTKQVIEAIKQKQASNRDKLLAASNSNHVYRACFNLEHLISAVNDSLQRNTDMTKELEQLEQSLASKHRRVYYATEINKPANAVIKSARTKHANQSSQSNIANNQSYASPPEPQLDLHGISFLSGGYSFYCTTDMAQAGDAPNFIATINDLKLTTDQACSLLRLLARQANLQRFMLDWHYACQCYIQRRFVIALTEDKLTNFTRPFTSLILATRKLSMPYKTAHPRPSSSDTSNMYMSNDYSDGAPNEASYYTQNFDIQRYLETSIHNAMPSHIQKTQEQDGHQAITKHVSISHLNACSFEFCLPIFDIMTDEQYGIRNDTQEARRHNQALTSNPCRHPNPVKGQLGNPLTAIPDDPEPQQVYYHHPLSIDHLLFANTHLSHTAQDRPMIYAHPIDSREQALNRTTALLQKWLKDLSSFDMCCAVAPLVKTELGANYQLQEAQVLDPPDHSGMPNFSPEQAYGARRVKTNAQTSHFQANLILRPETTIIGFLDHHYKRHALSAARDLDQLSRYLSYEERNEIIAKLAEQQI